MRMWGSSSGRMASTIGEETSAGNRVVRSYVAASDHCTKDSKWRTKRLSHGKPITKTILLDNVSFEHRKHVLKHVS